MVVVVCTMNVNWNEQDVAHIRGLVTQMSFDWAQPSWKYIHFWSFRALPDELSTDQQRDAKKTIEAWIGSIPCIDPCRFDALTWFAEHPINYRTRESIASALVDYHNHVNAKPQVNKPKVSYREAFAMYSGTTERKTESKRENILESQTTMKLGVALSVFFLTMSALRVFNSKSSSSSSQKDERKRQ